MVQPAAQAPSRHILLCVTGLTPQIITETFYVLTQQHRERVDEIRVITTLGGRDQIVATLLDRQEGKFFAFCQEYGIDPDSILFNETTIRLLHGMDGRTLADIRSIADNTAAANQICDIVRELTRHPHTRLHASAAGGRKTMSIYLTAAMQLFGRAQDRLSHVLVSEEFETQRDFFYIPRTPQEIQLTDRNGHVMKRLSTADAEIHLADIPFIRLQGVQAKWFPASGGSYSDLVQRAQDNLNLLDAVHELRINVRQKMIIVENRAVRVSERELFLYALLAYMREEGRGDNGFVQLDDVTPDDLDTVFRRITAAKGREYGLQDYDNMAGYGFLDTMARQLASTKPQDRGDLRKTWREIIAKIKRKCEAQGLPERYLIHSGARGSARYGLHMPPERIAWDTQAAPVASR